MSGNKLFLDTNIILYLLSGDQTLAKILNDKQFYISFISQLELLGYLGISKAEQKQVEGFLDQCTVIDINNRIKVETIRIRRKYKIKLPDAIIIASASYLDVPVITADAGFKKVEEIDLLYYQR